MPFIIIKHGQTKHNIEIDANTTVLTLKTQIYTLTNVHPERQKLVKAGKQIHDNDDLSSLKPNQLIMLLGTADDLPKVPEKTLFVEDMSAQQLANVLKVPSGLVNLGNTCYMAACIQCLRSIPELQVALKKANLNAVSDPQSSLVVSLRDLFRMLDNTADPVQPFAFVHLMRATLPRFNESGHHGFVQQDAEEFWVFYNN